MNAPLYGIVLTGGQSRRMQRDKASLPYAGLAQLDRAMGLLRTQVERAFVSVRADQLVEPHRAAYECIADRLPNLGPIGGIHAAQQTHPQSAWLVLACDLPFLDAGTLERLIGARDQARLATAYRSHYDGKPEPLCAIFEPASGPTIAAWIAAGKQCPREFLAQSDVQLLDLPEARALDNINTVAEYSAARERVAAPALSLRVQYFAVLRDQAGRSEEQVQSVARTPAELYRELRARHQLTLAPEMLRVAVNEDFGEWDQPLKDGDTVVYLPPVAGG